MLVGEKFWNSITMTPEEYKNKYEKDYEFWDEAGQYVYNRMVIDSKKKGKSYLKQKIKAEPWKDN